MPRIEVFTNAEANDPPLFEGDFDFLPGIGHTLAKDNGDFFEYYEVVGVWHREGRDVKDVWQGESTGHFKTCLLVKSID